MKEDFKKKKRKKLFRSRNEARIMRFLLLVIDQVTKIQNDFECENVFQFFVSRQEAHDEMLFITVHQQFEILFKQVLHELRDICTVFQQDHVSIPSPFSWN